MKSARILAMTLIAGVGILGAQSAALAAGPTSSTSSGSTASAAVSPSLSSLTLNATDVVGGSPVTGTVTLTSAAPPGGLLVALSSDNPAAATVPASISVPAGSTSASFSVSTLAVANSQSSDIIGTAGGVTTYAIVTVRPPFQFSNGSVSVLPAGNGNGTITSQPVGIRCTFAGGSSVGPCSAFFPVGTVVRLTAKAGAGSKFQGWRGLPGCGDPSKITVARGTTITCQPGFTL